MTIQRLPGSAITPGTITVTQLESSVSTVISTGGGPKITAIIVTDNAYTNLDDTAVNVSGGYIKITGTGFVTGCSIIIGSVVATSVSFISATEVRAQVPAQSAGTYTVYLVNPDGGVGIRVNGLNYSSTPTWSTTSPLPGGAKDTAISIQLVATSNSAVTFSLQAGSTLPAGLSLSSGGLLSGTVTGISVDTVYNFTIVATDGENQDTPQAFQITIVIGDPYYRLVTLHLPGNGTNGAQNNTFLDSSTNNFTITRNGNTTQGTFSPFSQTGWGNYFDGSGDYLSVASNAALQLDTTDFTIEFWWNGSPTGTFLQNIGTLITGAESGTYRVGTRVNSVNAVYFARGNGTSFDEVSFNVNVNDGAWHHIAIVRSSGVIVCYTDGISRTVLSGSANISGTCTSSNELRLGYNQRDGVYITGYMSNARIVKGVAVYTGNFTPPTSPLAATQSAGTNISAITGTQTSLLTCQSNRFIDNSSNNFTITVNGSPSVVAFSPFNPSASWSAATYGGSGYFDGSGDYISVTTSSAIGTGDFTLDWWVYHLQTPNPCWLWDGNFNGGSGPEIYITNSGTYFYYKTNIATIPNRLYQWVHYRICRSSSVVRLFINGIYTSQVADSQNYTQSFRGGFGARVRDGAESNQAYFGGFRTALTALSTTNTDFAPPTAPLTAIANTSLLLNFTNAGILDATSKNDLETVGNAQISNTTAKWGSTSMSFDGTGDSLVGINSPLRNFGTGDFTIEFWVYHSTLKNYSGLIGDRASPITTINIYTYADGKIGVTVLGSGEQFASASGIALATTWQHIALTRSSGAVNLYVGGTNRGTYSSSANMQVGNGAGLSIGSTFGTGDLNGYMQDVRVTSGYARYTGSTVGTNYFTPPTAAFPAL